MNTIPIQKSLYQLNLFNCRIDYSGLATIAYSFGDIFKP